MVWALTVSAVGVFFMGAFRYPDDGAVSAPGSRY